MQFFVLQQMVGSENETSYFEEQPANIGEAPTCPKCGSYIGMRPLLPPYRVELVRYGRQFGDIAFGFGSSLLVSEAFRAAWLHEKLRGLDEFDPVEIVRVKPRSAAEAAPRYFHVCVKRGRTRIDERRSELFWKMKPNCQYCLSDGNLEATCSLAIDDATWSGEDIFHPWGYSAAIVVTERVPKVALDHKLLNVPVTPVAKYVFDPLRKHCSGTVKFPN